MTELLQMVYPEIPARELADTPAIRVVSVVPAQPHELASDAAQDRHGILHDRSARADRPYWQVTLCPVERDHPFGTTGREMAVAKGSLNHFRRELEQGDGEVARLQKRLEQYQRKLIEAAAAVDAAWEAIQRGLTGEADLEPLEGQHRRAVNHRDVCAKIVADIGKALTDARFRAELDNAERLLEKTKELFTVADAKNEEARARLAAALEPFLADALAADEVWRFLKEELRNCHRDHNLIASRRPIAPAPPAAPAAPAADIHHPFLLNARPATPFAFDVLRGAGKTIPGLTRPEPAPRQPAKPPAADQASEGAVVAEPAT